MTLQLLEWLRRAAQ